MPIEIGHAWQNVHHKRRPKLTAAINQCKSAEYFDQTGTKSVTAHTHSQSWPRHEITDTTPDLEGMQIVFGDLLWASMLALPSSFERC